MGDNGKIIGGIETKDDNIKPAIPPDPEVVVNSVTIMEVRVNLLANGRERTEVIAHEFMMTEQKRYMIDKLCEALVRISRGIVKNTKGEFIRDYSKARRLYLAEKISEGIKMVNRAVKMTPIIKRLPSGMNNLRQFLAQKRR